MRTAIAIVSGVFWLGLMGALMWRLRKRRSHIHAAAVGTVYEMLNEDKRNAVELIVEDKAAERDPERATDKDTGPADPADETSH